MQTHAHARAHTHTRTYTHEIVDHMYMYIMKGLPKRGFPETQDCLKFRVVVCTSHLSKTYDNGFTI